MLNQAIPYFQWLRALSTVHIGALLIVLVAIVSLVQATPLTRADSSLVTSNTSTVVTPKEEAPKKSEQPKKQTPSSSSQKAVSSASTSQASRPAHSPAPAITTPARVYDSVSIPSLGFSSELVTVGVTSSNNVDVHPTLVGWYNGSAAIGSKGAAFLDGHNPGVFSSLPGIAIGSQISIKKAGVTYTYQVVYREIVPLVEVNMNKVLSVYGDDDEGLNLMTCIGAYNPSTGTTDERLIVYAVRSN
jgi:sortase (surface protein transpeptidase)